MQMNGRNKPLNPPFNSKHIQPLKMQKAAKSPNLLTPHSKPHKAVNPRLKPPKGLCPKGGDVCNCHPRTIKH